MPREDPTEKKKEKSKEEKKQEPQVMEVPINIELINSKMNQVFNLLNHLIVQQSEILKIIKKK